MKVVVSLPDVMIENELNGNEAGMLPFSLDEGCTEHSNILTHNYLPDRQSVCIVR